MIRRIDPNKRLSAAVVHGGIVYVSGQVPDTLHATVEVQTREILAKIDRLLQQAGSDKTRILSAQIFLADMADFARVNEVYARHLGDARPARSTVAVAGLPRGARVEIEVVAAVDA